MSFAMYLRVVVIVLLACTWRASYAETLLVLAAGESSMVFGFFNAIERIQLGNGLWCAGHRRRPCPLFPQIKVIEEVMLG